MSAAVVIAARVVPLLLLGGAADDAPVSPNLTPRSHAGDDTRCAACHTVNSWVEVVFPHERTGFPLKGAHEKTACKACHPVDFVQKVPDTCAGCHRDVHRGDLGARCVTCHDENSWRTLFTIDAHRQTNFPLSGRHAVIPCESCHTALRDQSFVRPTVDCDGCHDKDYTSTFVTPVNHQTLGFDKQCRNCHDTWRFTGALYPGHDVCFQLSVGPHAGIDCLSCHSGIPPPSANQCSTHTAQCTNCHDHTQSRTDAQHVGVPGYQYKDFKCYQCHRFTTSP